MKLSLVKTAIIGVALLTFGCAIKQSNSSASMNASASLATKPAPPEDKLAPGAYTIDGTPLKFKDTVQPTKPLILDWDSDDKKYLKLASEYAFDHTAHATKKEYSEDGTRVVGCAECHHTDQPSAPAGSEYLKKFQRAKVLTAENLAEQAVETCRACHLSVREDETEENPPPFAYPEGSGKTASKEKLDNEEAYHLNCNTCHNKAKERANPKPGPKLSKMGCDTCHTKPA